MLRPLFRALNDPEEYIRAFRALSPEQIAALEYWEKESGTRLVRPEIFAAELRWNSIRRGTILRLIPDPELARTWYERFIAILPGLVLAVGLAFAVESKPWVTALVLARTPLGCRRHMDARFRELQAQIQKRLLIPNSRADEARELAGIIVEAGEHRLAIVPHVISLYHHPKSRDFVDGQRPRTSLRSRITLN